MDINYSDCIFHGLDSRVCGPRAKNSKPGIYVAKDLLDDMVPKLGFNLCKDLITELDIIKNRSGAMIQPDDLICAGHRYFYGVDFKVATNKCHHPVCIAQEKKVKPASLQLASYHMYKELDRKYGTFLLGGYLCSTHRSRPLPEEPECQMNESFSDERNVAGYDDEAMMSEYEDNEENISNLKAVMEASFVSPLKYRCSNQQTWSGVNVRSKQYGRQKLKELREHVDALFAQVYCPQDPEGFLSEMNATSTPKSDVLTLEQLVPLYDSAQTSRGKFAILTIAAKHFPKSKVQAAFGCSARQVSKAREVEKAVGICEEISKAPIKRRRLDEAQIRHFLDYLFDTGAFLTAAYGTNVVTYSNETKIEVPKPVLSGVRRHICQAYIDLCNQMRQTHYSLSTYERIIADLKPSSKCAMTGLDNFLVEGEDSIKDLTEVVRKIEDNKETCLNLIKQLQKVEIYLKTNQTLHCSNDASCISHCLTCSLSDPKQTEFAVVCEVDHSHRCPDCDLVIDTVDAISEAVSKYNGDDKQSNKFDFDVCRERLVNWMAHNVRGRQQTAAKSFTSDEVSAETFLWLSDWAHKVLPLRFRENQIEYFGKRGKSVHVDVIFRKTESLEKYVYLTCIDQSEQGLVDTLVVRQNVLSQVRADFPDVKAMFIRSDNASCYASNGTFEALYNMCDDVGVQLKRVDFSEPRKGKDQADRECAIFKSFMRNYIASGNNVMTAEDLKRSILYRGGPKRTKVAVIEIDKTSKLENIRAIKKISEMHCVSFEDGVMTLWRYYNIGSGRRREISNTKLVSKFKVTSEFNETTRDEGMLPRSTATSSKTPFFCAKFACDAVFDTEQELDAHMIAGKHKEVQARSSYDSVKTVYRQLAVSDIEQFRPAPVVCGAVASSGASNFFTVGWALPLRKGGKLDKEARKFVCDIFNQGKRTGNKWTAEKIAAKMRSETNENGEKRFGAGQYMTTKQIKSLLGRLAAEPKDKEDMTTDQLEMVSMLREIDQFTE